MTYRWKDVLIIAVALIILIFAFVGVVYGLNQLVACMDEVNDVWACLR